MRTESDFIGQCEIPIDALYGIHSLRACENFPNHTPFHIAWYKAMGQVKLACYLTVEAFDDAIKRSGRHSKWLTLPDPDTLNALQWAASQVAAGEYFNHFVVPAIQGGAGTSINMNVNEILANLALVHRGFLPGNYTEIDPIAHANIYQSTNDVVPTSLRVAAMTMLQGLEEGINHTRASFEHLEKEHSNTLRLGYTQMQEAVPTTFGRFFSTWSDALSRDWWRVSKSFERIKEVNIGGSAIGTSAGVPRYVAIQIVQHLQQVTGLPVTRAENLQDNTSNLDSFVEVHAILKAHAVNIEKLSSDIRLLASDIVGSHQMSIPAVQMGSTIMPAKVNPVIAEYCISVAHQVYTNDSLITRLCAQGCLELNAYLPLIGHALLESLQLLSSCHQVLSDKLLKGLSIDASAAFRRIIASPAVTTLLVPALGYHQATEIAQCMRQNGWTVFQVNEQMNFMSDEALAALLNPSEVLKGGFSIDDIQVHHE